MEKILQEIRHMLDEQAKVINDMRRNIVHIERKIDDLIEKSNQK